MTTILENANGVRITEGDELRAEVERKRATIVKQNEVVIETRDRLWRMLRQVPICRAEDLADQSLLPSLGLKPEDPLYALPGAQAQPAPSVPMDVIADYLVSISAHLARRDDAKAQAEIGELLKMIASAPKPVPSVPDDIVRGSARLLKRASGHLRWLKKDTYQWQCLNPKTRRAAELLHRDIDAMLAAAPEAKP